MKILIALCSEAEQEKLKAKLAQLGHETCVAESLHRLKNLLRAEHVFDGVITERQLKDCKGTNIIATIDFATQALVFGATSRFANFILKKRCMPNVTFVTEALVSERDEKHIESWLLTLKKNCPVQLERT